MSSGGDTASGSFVNGYTLLQKQGLEDKNGIPGTSIAVAKLFMESLYIYSKKPRSTHDSLLKFEKLIVSKCD